MKLYEIIFSDERCGYLFKSEIGLDEIAMILNGGIEFLKIDDEVIRMRKVSKIKISNAEVESENVPTIEFPIYKPTMVVPKEYGDAVFLRNILNDEIERIKNGTSNKETLEWLAENINDKLVGLKWR